MGAKSMEAGREMEAVILTFKPPRGQSSGGEDRSAQLHHRDQRLDKGIEALVSPLIWKL